MSEPTVRRRRLGSELRRLREDVAALTQEDVEAQLGIKPAKLSRIERATQGVKPAELDALLDLYTLTEDHDHEKRTALHVLARDGSKRGWWQQYRDIASPAYLDLISLEADAKSMRSFETLFIPGLLQTAAYARATIHDGRPAATPEQVSALVEVRQARQAVLTTRDVPLDFWAIIHEAALRPRLAANPQVMKDQLQRLLDLAQFPNVAIQVLPLDAPPHPGMAGAYAVLGFPETADLDVVHIEHLTSSLYVEDRAEVAVYGAAFERLQAAALPFDESADLIARTKEQIE
ncbi:Scr1 family TA system antitoxin-like transcriptional regulator [Streptomyces sp. DW26H14]|uniref:Scr1 family TA system antitoxin-like transcriptional regulator n=1 Tax=Streptomyces sp. DW26H14 TaxID=3435395 RepID=UPI00403DD8D8